MQRKYKTLSGQSIYDVCLNTYGTLSLLKTLLLDNGLTDISSVIPPGTELVWDDDKVFDVLVLRANKVYATALDSDGIDPSTIVFSDESSTSSNLVIFVTEGDNPSYFKE